ncbi:MAG: hypothetical protein IJ740_18355, partial [Ruminococcus sp.]|nr:hypothetical protein [Ruminococcus sp.]
YDESAEPLEPQAEEEADDSERETDPQDIADGYAKEAFNAVMEYLAEQQLEGMTWADVFERGDFEKAYSENGLDLSISPEADGDFLLYSQFYLYESGTVYIDFKPNGSDSGRLTVRWKDKDGVTLDTGVKELPDSSLGDAVISPAVWVTASSDSGEEIQIDLCFEVNDKYRRAPASRYGKVADIFNTYQRFTVFRYDEDKKKYTSDFSTYNSDYKEPLVENAPSRLHISAMSHTPGTYCLVDADAYLDMLDIPEKEIYVLFRDQPGWMPDEFASDNYVELAEVM